MAFELKIGCRRLSFLHCCVFESLNRNSRGQVLLSRCIRFLFLTTGCLSGHTRAAPAAAETTAFSSSWQCLSRFTRSRDVAALRANMTFDPVKINLQKTQCVHAGRASVCVQMTVCFDYSIKSNNQDEKPAAGEPFGVLSIPPKLSKLLAVRDSLSVVSRSDPLQSHSGCPACQSQGFI